MSDNQLTMEKIVSLCKRRGFVFPGSEIYGGMANSWDYGPYGTELKKNIADTWWKTFVQKREDIVGLDSAIITNPKVWRRAAMFLILMILWLIAGNARLVTEEINFWKRKLEWMRRRKFP